MAKNIVLCIDGTGNEFGTDNSNVIKLYSALDCSDQRQLAFYHPGLGTMGSPNALSRFSQWWTKVFGLAFGFGISGAIQDCYAFLMENYETGDSIFIFGFSRGAYCARALSAMLHMYGLVRKGNDPLIRYVLRLFKKKSKTNNDFALAAKFKATFSRSCKSHFVGVWDTVSSVGWLYDPLKLPYTAANPDIEVGRHAISIDERRCAFRQNLWTSTTTPNQSIEQIWFAGVHSDIGGGYAEAESGLSKITLQWMIEEAEANGLLINALRRDQILGVTDPTMAKAESTAQLHKSLKGWWWLLEVFPRRYWDATVVPPRDRWKIPLGMPRHIAAGSFIHSTVRERIRDVADYRPPNIPNA